ncbi:MAG: AbrB/MazE/SpoVT family DNA-binding domain-containing protein [Thaumarchaeota archaeon]|nr:AbrB/MazE/SpoVT family DNA-binding domain-containing protein [Nitrososphaerota archaeon]MBI3023861.1 AbrB/MazE/SpoVT family DNA-binding domain-containing protein [Nitrososphaerota archaeon]MBI3116731.1 AbrB/MazE/SpoVT family DNA-binding domain-containing protein [Nitrososphaerota archaeon]MCS4539794.1 AbrB/MazE/SpoVT family DNA-binding domain-containing protein [Nitrososphaerota archaeon]
MAETATVTSKSMVNLPSKIRKKYGLTPGSKVVFIDSDSGILMIPVPPIMKLFGADREHKAALIEAIRELNEEHRRESRER